MNTLMTLFDGVVVVRGCCSCEDGDVESMLLVQVNAATKSNECKVA